MDEYTDLSINNKRVVVMNNSAEHYAAQSELNVEIVVKSSYTDVIQHMGKSSHFLLPLIFFSLPGHSKLLIRIQFFKCNLRNFQGDFYLNKYLRSTNSYKFKEKLTCSSEYLSARAQSAKNNLVRLGERYGVLDL